MRFRVQYCWFMFLFYFFYNFLVVALMFVDGANKLSGNMVASSFGKLVTKERPREGVREEDLALALLMMITNNIGQVAYLTAQLQKCSKIYFVGNFLRQNPISCRRLAYAIAFWSENAMEALFLAHEGHFGALGTFLQSAFGEDVDKVININNVLRDRNGQAEGSNVGSSDENDGSSSGEGSRATSNAYPWSVHRKTKSSDNIPDVAAAAAASMGSSTEFTSVIGAEGVAALPSFATTTSFATSSSPASLSGRSMRGRSFSDDYASSRSAVKLKSSEFCAPGPSSSHSSSSHSSNRSSNSSGNSSSGNAQCIVDISRIEKM
jgi:hypothetical protein